MGIGVGVAVGIVHAMVSSVPKPKTISQRSTVRMVGIVAEWPCQRLGVDVLSGS